MRNVFCHYYCTYPIASTSFSLKNCLKSSTEAEYGMPDTNNYLGVHYYSTTFVGSLDLTFFLGYSLTSSSSELLLKVSSFFVFVI